MSSLQDLLHSGRVLLSDRREHPRFRFRGPVEIIAVDVVGSIIPTDIKGFTTDISSVGTVLTVQKKLTTNGVFIRFAEADELVMPARIIRTMSEQNGFFTYACEFASTFDNDQLIRVMSHTESEEFSAEPSQLTTT